MKNKPTKRDIMIVEDFVKKTTKSMMNEAPETNLEQLFDRWLKTTAKQSRISPKDYARGIFIYFKKEYKF